MVGRRLPGVLACGGARAAGGRASGRPRRQRCPGALVRVSGARSIVAEQAFRATLARVLGFWRWARRPAEHRDIAVVVGLRMWREHMVLRPVCLGPASARRPLRWRSSGGSAPTGAASRSACIPRSGTGGARRRSRPRPWWTSGFVGRGERSSFLCPWRARGARGPRPRAVRHAHRKKRAYGSLSGGGADFLAPCVPAGVLIYRVAEAQM